MYVTTYWPVALCIVYVFMMCIYCIHCWRSCCLLLFMLQWTGRSNKYYVLLSCTVPIVHYFVKEHDDVLCLGRHGLVVMMLIHRATDLKSNSQMNEWMHLHCIYRFNAFQIAWPDYDRNNVGVRNMLLAVSIIDFILSISMSMWSHEVYSKICRLWSNNI